MSLPQVNATVVRVATGVARLGDRDDFDEARQAVADTSPIAEPAGAGTTMWEGAEPAYVTDELIDTEGAAGPTTTRRRSLIVSSAWAVARGVDVDDVLTIELESGGTVTGKASTIAVRQWAGGRSARIQTARLDLTID